MVHKDGQMDTVLHHGHAMAVKGSHSSNPSS